MKVHMPDEFGFGHGLCGARSENIKLTKDPGEVTCLSCQDRIEEEMKPLEEVIEEEARRKARTRARSRAVSDLVEQHYDEFDRLWKQHESTAIDEARAEAKREIEARREWERERIERRRAELERELERLA